MIGQQARYKQVKATLGHPARLRNVSIVAHVDHGKTTLADCLIASNGIIHRRQAGQLRMMDDRLDQQDRGITMKSSSIALLYRENLINLIDSPGHFQFYSEVSSALRVTDAALLVVDTVEGVSSQTYRVLQQLYTQKLPSILILNKVDKLIVHCKMDPLQAFLHLTQLIEHVNAILGSFIAKEVGSNVENDDKGQEQPINALESFFYFSPEKKNVIFSSALDNWGFAIESFSPLIAKKLGKKPEEIQKYLWGQYYFNPKTKTFSTEPRNENDKPLCVDWILKPIWDIFENVENDNMEKIDKIVTALNIKVSEAAKKAKGYALIKEIVNSWLPLDKLLLDRIVNQLPSPIEAQKFRLPYLLQLNSRQHNLSPVISKALSSCIPSEEVPLICFISKMITVPRKQINERGLPNSNEEESVVIGFARIFSGRVRRGQQVLVIGVKPKKIVDENGETIQIPDISTAKITGIYYFNGQYPEGIEEASAGCVVGLAGLENYIFKSGTISTSEECLSFVPISSKTKSILKVSISTPDIKNGPKLLEGLKKLNRSDPSVDVYVEGTGDYILNTCGQVHLEKCVTDLENIYCKVPIKTSEPIITFRETITWFTLKETKNQKYLQDLQKRKLQQQKKLQKEQFRAQMMADAELDQQEKEKQRAVREWDHHVEIYESEDLTVQDIRFFFKNRDDMDEDKEVFLYKKEKELKKVDHKNRGKMHSKQKFLNLNLKTNLVTLKTPNQKLAITVRALGMPFAIAEYLERNIEKMQKIFAALQKHQTFDQTNPDVKLKIDRLSEQAREYIKALETEFDQCGLQEGVKQLIRDKMVCFGPNPTAGSNILLIQSISSQQSFLIRAKTGIFQQEQTEWQLDPSVLKILDEYKTTPKQLFTAVKNGFCLACSSGPLANEVMMGVIFIIENIQAVEQPKVQKSQIKQEVKQQVKQEVEQKTELEEEIEKKEVETKEQVKIEEVESKQETENLWAKDNFGPLAGQVISTIKDSCIESFLGGSPRLAEPMYLCQLHTHQQYYGSIYNELSKRRAQVVSEDLHEFSNFFIIKAHLPMLQSKNFCFDVLDKTQGTVNAQLDLDTWKIIEEDPFYTPLTIEEIEENGMDSTIHNQARIILEKIRQKKGLSGTEKIVVAAQKQRTLKKD